MLRKVGLIRITSYNVCYTKLLRFTSYTTPQLEKILENTLQNGTQLGWEFTNVSNNSSDSFSLYQDDWSPKRVIGLVDNYWGYWLKRVDEIVLE